MTTRIQKLTLRTIALVVVALALTVGGAGATAGLEAAAVSSQVRPFRVSSCGSRSRSWWARRTAVRRRRGSETWKRSSITEVCRVCGNWRAEPSISASVGRFGH